MPETSYIVLLIGMGLATFVPRWFPLFLLSQRRLPQWLIEWLDLIPVAILSALILPDLLLSSGMTSEGLRRIDLLNVKSLVAVPTLLVALWTKSLGGTVVFGMLLYWLAGTWLS